VAKSFGITLPLRCQKLPVIPLIALRAGQEGQLAVIKVISGALSKSGWTSREGVGLGPRENDSRQAAALGSIDHQYVGPCSPEFASGSRF
jgi:hypothetical protein